MYLEVNMTGQFSKAQTTVAIGVVLGSILCLIGIASPYWLVAEVVGEIVYSGLWQMCGQDHGHTECDTFDMNEVEDYFHAIRGCALACLFLGCVSGIMAISLAIGRQDSKPILVGIISFIGGLCGLTAVGIFVGKYEEANRQLDINLNDYVKYGWAFGLFCAGAAVLIVISIVAFCASPNNPIRGYIFNHPSVIVTQAGPNPYHNMSSTTGVIINQSQASYGIPYYGPAERGYGVTVVTK